MQWYRAEIKGDGFFFDGGSLLLEKKVVEYIFRALSDEDAERIVRIFAGSREFRREYWVTDMNPEVVLTKFVGGTYIPQEASARLINS